MQYAASFSRSIYRLSRISRFHFLHMVMLTEKIASPTSIFSLRIDHAICKQHDERKMAVRTPSKASPASRTARLSPKKSSTAVQRYLVLYNLVSAVIWGYCLFSLGLHLSSSKSLDDLVANAASGHSVYAFQVHFLSKCRLVTDVEGGTNSFGETVKYVQTVALLELVHVVFGLV